MEQERCERCGRNLGAAREGTHYCERCMHSIEQNGSRGLWIATIAMLVGLVALAAGLALLAPRLGSEITGTGRLFIGLVVTILPALLWLALFYQQDRLEPEPRAFVISLFILGFLMGGAVAQPLLRSVFEVQRWAEPGSMMHLLSATLLNGLITASLTYFAVRFTVFPTEEFDERIDGIIYGTAAALGLGVAANLIYLLENGTISLGVGALTIIVTSLVYATFGAIVGYFLGLIKPGGGPDWLGPAGVIVAAVLHGLYEWLTSRLGQTGGLSYNPWPGLIVTALFSLATFGLVFMLIRNAYKGMTLPAVEESAA